MRKLVIAEKPSVAMTIAKALGVKGKRNNGYIEDDRYVISWCIGHLADLAGCEVYNESYAKWKKEDLPIIPDVYMYTTHPEKAAQMNVLKGLMNRKDITEVINACDAGREGERIFRTAYSLNYCKKPIKRLWISSMEDAAIVEGFKNLKDGNDFNNLYNAAECRARADWLVGINATRLFSTVYHRTLKIGRVASPTLAMLVDRKAETDNFIPEDYYKVQIECDDFSVTSESISDSKQAYELANNCKDKVLICTDIEVTRKAEKPPLLYDLTALQREANRKFGYSAQQTLDCAQALYEKKLLTYPRTDSRFLTDDMAEKITGILKFAGKFLDVQPYFGNEANLCDSTKVSDHYAIIPTMQAAKTDIHALPIAEQKIFEMVLKRFIEAAGEDYIYDRCTAKFQCADFSFSLSFRKTVSTGWKNEIEEAPYEITEGEVFDIRNVSVKSEKTKPKPPFTEDTLLSAMEKAGAKNMPDEAERKGLGTPATRAGIIEKLISDGLVKREKGKLIPTETGINLISVMPDELKSEDMTVRWEKYLKEIENGRDPNIFMEKITDFVTLLVENYFPVDNADKLFPSGKEVLGKCPRCGGNVTETPKGYFCETNNCRFGVWKDNKFLSERNIVPNTKLISALLKDGKIKIKDIVSTKNGKKYSANLILEDNGENTHFKIKI